MKVGIVWQSVYPWDVRIDKFVRSLIKAGCQVSVLANAGGEAESYLGARIYRMPSYARPLPTSSAWRSFIARTATELQLDWLIVRDLPLFGAAWGTARRQGIRIWLDMAEDYPATFLDLQRSVVERLTVRNYHLARWYERWAISRADAITVVVEESRQRLLRKGISNSKVWIIGNPPHAEFIASQEPVPLEVQARLEEHPGVRLLYHGNLGAKRGLETAVSAVCRLQGARLLVAGGKEKEARQLLDMAAGLGRPDAVVWLGVVPYLTLPALIRQCEIGIVPHRRTVHTDTTIPNKLFDLMALARPVLVADVPPLKRVVEESGAGLVFRSGDEKDLADKLKLLRDNAELREVLGQRGLQAFQQRYGWEKAERSIAAILLTAGRQSPQQ